MRSAAAAPFPSLPPLAALLLAACGGGGSAVSDALSPPPSAPPSRAMARWQPGPGDTCTQEQHDRWAVLGPDGKRYPAWHPPVDPESGCSYGHEHGRDPRGSRLYALTGGLPFGYANEVLAAADPANPRDEDHVGHKVEWENGIEMQVQGPAGSLLRVTCDVLTKLHQGTHSRDALANNVHELNYYIQCSDGTDLRITMLTAIGNPGEFERGCDRSVKVQTGAAVPANSPRNGGARIIPDRHCVEQHMLVPAGTTSDIGRALHESWQTSNSIRRADGRTLAFFNPYYQVLRPSRFHDPTALGIIGRPIDVCYDTTTAERARGGECASSTNNGATAGVTWDDARSRFNGVRRFVDVNSNRIDNAGGPTVWYTDAYGRNASPVAFPNSIRQYIASVNNDIGVNVGGPQIGRDRDYGGAGVRAPN